MGEREKRKGRVMVGEGKQHTVSKSVLSGCRENAMHSVKRERAMLSNATSLLKPGIKAKEEESSSKHSTF